MKKRKIPRVLSYNEVASMFKMAEKSPRDCMLLKCIYYLALSNSDVRSLKTNHIDFVNRKVMVVNRGRIRFVPIPGNFHMELDEFVEGRRGFVFSGRNEALSDRHIRRIVKSHACRANVRNCAEIHPHTLRHSYAYHMKSSGVPLGEIQKILGHERKETTTIYSHVNENGVS